MGRRSWFRSRGMCSAYLCVFGSGFIFIGLQKIQQSKVAKVVYLPPRQGLEGSPQEVLGPLGPRAPARHWPGARRRGGGVPQGLRPAAGVPGAVAGLRGAPGGVLRGAAEARWAVPAGICFFFFLCFYNCKNKHCFWARVFLGPVVLGL